MNGFVAITSQSSKMLCQVTHISTNLMSVPQSDLCYFCCSKIETLSQLFVECNRVPSFIIGFKKFLLGSGIHFSKDYIFFGY